MVIIRVAFFSFLPPRSCCERPNHGLLLAESPLEHDT